MDKVVFLENNAITDSGRQVIDYMNAAITEAEKDANPSAINSLSGMVKHYYVNVFKARTMTESDWLRDHRNAASAVWDVLEGLREAEAQKQAVQEATEGQSKLTQELTTLRESLAQALKRIAELEKKSPKGKAAKTVDDVDEPVTEGANEADAESEA